MIKERNRCFFCEEMFDTNEMSTFIQGYYEKGRYVYNGVCGNQKCLIERNEHESYIIKLLGVEKKSIKKGGKKWLKQS